ncbi:MAG: heparan-alpha-glucosaminide N-acetyltransferase domain-containing protein [Candidatus Sumerlaeota bacterium]
MSEPVISSQPLRSERLFSIDAFRGFTIFGMVLVIAVAAGGYQYDGGGLPQKMSWFGSLPVSTWFHAEVGYDLWEEDQIAAWDATHKAEHAADAKTDEAARTAFIESQPQHNLKGIGVDFTDLIAPWFVFIVGVCVPLSKSRRGGDWWKHALMRSIMLIVAGMIYISLVLKGITWWWGVLQAIGVAYFMAAAVTQVSPRIRWIVIFAVGFYNLGMTELFPYWTNAWENIDKPFGTLNNPAGSWIKPWIVHCQPWLSISYGVIAMIGVLVGDALTTRDPKRIVRTSLLVGAVFSIVGYAIHKIGFATENYSLCMNKPDVTTSYAFFTAGLGAFAYCAFYYVIDVLKFHTWAKPFTVFGSNALLAYFMMIILRRAFETLGINGAGADWQKVGFFNRVTEANTTVYNWAHMLSSNDQPAGWVLNFFRKSGYHGLMWGLIWTGCIWLIVLFFNKKKIYWKL